MIHILIAEDHLMVRAGIRALLEKVGDMVILGEASNGQEAIDMTESLNPDVLIMDIMMPRLNGIQAAEQLRSRKHRVNILLLSMYADEGLVYQALQSGANGYVLKSSASDELVEAVREIANGKNSSFSRESTCSSVIGSRIIAPSRSKNRIFFISCVLAKM